MLAAQLETLTSGVVTVANKVRTFYKAETLITRCSFADA